jgi:hypothetical protein
MRRQMCHSVQQENSPPDLATLERSRAAGGLRWVAMGRRSRRPALAWALGRWVDVARRHRDDTNHRGSALLVAASGGTGAARAIQPSSPVQRPAEPIANRAAMPSLSSPARPPSLEGAVDVSGLVLGGSGCSALRGWVRARMNNQLTAQPALSTVTPPRTAPPGLSSPACASRS